VTRQIKCLIAQALGEGGVIPHPIPEVNFLMVEISTPNPYIFMIRMNRRGSPKEHLGKVWLKLTKWFQRYV
jgi:hypothetical protein